MSERGRSGEMRKRRRVERRVCQLIREGWPGESEDGQGSNERRKSREKEEKRRSDK